MDLAVFKAVYGPMAPVRLALVSALGALLLAPQAAAGGGWWTYIHPDRTTVAPGERVEVHEQVLFRTMAEAEAATETGQFYVYLLEGFDYSVVHRVMGERSPRNWWSLHGAEAIQVAPVTLSLNDVNLGRASVSFTVPELPAGTYHLMLCDAGCQAPLANVIPARGFTIVADPATAALSQRVDGLERVVRQQARLREHALATVRTGLRRATDAAAGSTRSVERLSARVALLEGENPSLAAYAGWFVAGALAGALALLVVSRRRRRTTDHARGVGGIGSSPPFGPQDGRSARSRARAAAHSGETD